MISSVRVAIAHGDPEYNAAKIGELVRRCLSLLSPKEDRRGPLAWLIQPGDTVLVKPNLVQHYHAAGGDIRTVVTDRSVIGAALEFVAQALAGRGTIVIGDAPLQKADWSALDRLLDLQLLGERHRAPELSIDILDFRRTAATMGPLRQITGRRSLAGDPRGYRTVRLDHRSLLFELDADWRRYSVTNYDPALMRQHHRPGVHEYLIAGSALAADVVINLPKLKTHRKVGVTLSLKNCVGISGDKNWLPHHRSGSVAEGGDEYQARNAAKRLYSELAERQDTAPGLLSKYAYAAARKLLEPLVCLFRRDSYREGSWWGNDTLWRTVLDLNRLLIYADKNGELHSTPQRRFLSLVDAVIAGDGEGPLEPNVRKLGVIACGENPVAVDATCATLMGFDHTLIPVIARAFDIRELPLVAFRADDIECASDEPRCRGGLEALRRNHLGFRPPAGWATALAGHTPVHADGRVVTSAATPTRA